MESEIVRRDDYVVVRDHGTMNATYIANLVHVEHRNIPLVAISAKVTQVDEDRTMCDEEELLRL